MWYHYCILLWRSWLVEDTMVVEVTAELEGEVVTAVVEAVEVEVETAASEADPVAEATETEQGAEAWVGAAPSR